MTNAFPQAELQRIPRETFVAEVWYRREMESTNSQALELAGGPRAFPLLVLTDRQTAGRGRGANRWWSGDGGLTFSLVLEWPIPPAAELGIAGAKPTTTGITLDAKSRSEQRFNSDPRAVSTPAEASSPAEDEPIATTGRPGVANGARISLVSALAVRQVICQFAPGRNVGLKWPNDVFLEDRKVCGILVEIRPDAANKLVLGIGLNVNNSFHYAPEAVRSRGTSLRDATGQPLVMSQVLCSLITSLDRHLQQMGAEQFELVRAWRPHCTLSGRWVEIDTGRRKLFGRCEGIAEDGSLVLTTETGRKRCYSGVVRRVAR